MDRVSDEWLDEQISYYDGLGNEVSGLGMARCAALVELRDRRAAEREQAAPEPDTWPLGWTLVQDGGMVRVVNGKGVAVAAYAIQIESAPVVPRNVQCHDVADFYKDEEPQAEAAPTEPRLARWERRLDKMSATLIPPSASWRGKWRCEYDLGNEIMGFNRDTAKAAVKAAWKACKEARS